MTFSFIPRALYTRSALLLALAFCLAPGLAACSGTPEDKKPEQSAQQPAPEPAQQPVPESTQQPAPESAQQPAPESATAGTPEAAPAGEPGRTLFSFHDFAVRTWPIAGEDRLVTLRVTYRGALVAEEESVYAQMDAGPVLESFPLADCSTAVMTMFTGGANCCFGSYIFTRCGERDYLSVIEPYDGGIGEEWESPAGQGRGFVISDGFFMYYEPEGQAGDSRLSFSRVISPRPLRILLFEDGVWRADTPGEFPDRYRALIRETENDAALDPSARAITLAYYTMMAGDPAAGELLRTKLPARYAQLSGTIFTDITNAVTGFAPARPLPLP